MQLEHIDLAQLTISRANMRAKHKNDFADLIPSIRARHVFVPLIVRPNGEPGQYEIVAGRRRFLAACAVAQEGEGPSTVPCAVMETGDDAAALEISLLENVARLNADEVTQWETFARLTKEGRSVDEIAATFGITEQVVRRVLALGNLLPRIRTLYRKDLIDIGSVRQLTLATPAQQREWLALFDSPDSYAPTGRVLKEWLFGGSAIRTSAALFDLADYTAPIVADLFDEHSYFSDSTLFWTLQTKAIEAKREAYRAEGWSNVIVLTDGRSFDRWQHEKRSRAKGGRVYIAVRPHGAVEAHEGFMPRKEVDRLDRTEQPAMAATRPELTAPLRRYVDLHRHAAARACLLGSVAFAVRAMLAHAIAGSPLWSVRCEWQKAERPDTQLSVASSKAQSAFDERRKEALVLLGFDPERTLVNAVVHPPLAAILETLTGLSDDEVLELIPIMMGETLEAGSDAVDFIGRYLGVDTADFWQADDAFYALLRDRSVVRELLGEVAGQGVAEANADAPIKVLKAILSDCLEGRNGRSKTEGWVPRWLRFPSTTYREAQRSGISEELEPPAPAKGKSETAHADLPD